MGSLYGGSYMDSLKLSKCTQECGERAGKILQFLEFLFYVSYIYIYIPSKNQEKWQIFMGPKSDHLIKCYAQVSPTCIMWG